MYLKYVPQINSLLAVKADLFAKKDLLIKRTLEEGTEDPDINKNLVKVHSVGCVPGPRDAVFQQMFTASYWDDFRDTCVPPRWDPVLARCPSPLSLEQHFAASDSVCPKLTAPSLTSRRGIAVPPPLDLSCLGEAPVPRAPPLTPLTPLSQSSAPAELLSPLTPLASSSPASAMKRSLSIPSPLPRSPPGAMSICPLSQQTMPSPGLPPAQLTTPHKQAVPRAVLASVPSSSADTLLRRKGGNSPSSGPPSPPPPSSPPPSSPLPSASPLQVSPLPPAAATLDERYRNIGPITSGSPSEDATKRGAPSPLRPVMPYPLSGAFDDLVQERPPPTTREEEQPPKKRFRAEKDNERRKRNKSRPQQKQKQEAKLAEKHKQRARVLFTGGNLVDCRASKEGWNGSGSSAGLPAPARTLDESIAMGYKYFAWDGK